MDRRAWRATVHGVTKSRTQPSRNQGKDSCHQGRRMKGLGGGGGGAWCPFSGSSSLLCWESCSQSQMGILRVLEGKGLSAPPILFLP